MVACNSTATMQFERNIKIQYDELTATQSSKVGLEMNTSKTKIITMCTKNQPQIEINKKCCM